MAKRRESAVRFIIWSILTLAAVPKASFAGVGGHTLWIPNTGDQRLIKATTVRLVIDNGKRVWPFCTGVALSEFEVLTAGHCIIPEVAKGQVFAEFTSPNRPGRRMRIQVTSVGSEDTDDCDIALLRLAKPSPIRFSLPIAYEDCDAGSSFVAAGFGVNDQEGIEAEKRAVAVATAYQLTSNPARRGSFEVVARLQTWFTETTGSDMVQLKTEKGHICFGDSGGPVFCRSHGRLSLAGIINSMSSDIRMPMADRKYSSTRQFCADENLLFITPIRKEINLLERWRSPGSEILAEGFGARFLR